MPTHPSGWLLLPLLLSLTACDAPLRHGLDQEQAQQISQALQQEGLRPTTSQDAQQRWDVSVPSPQHGAAQKILAQRGLPRRSPSSLQRWTEQRGLLPSPEQQRAAHQLALAGQMERSLLSLEGVQDARVHLSLPPRPSLQLPQVSQEPARASVLLKLLPEATPPPQAQLKALVAHAVPGLQPQQVALVIQPSPRRSSPALELASVGPFPVEAGARAPLLWTLVALALVILLQSGAIALLLLRQRRRP